MAVEAAAGAAAATVVVAARAHDARGSQYVHTGVCEGRAAGQVRAVQGVKARLSTRRRARGGCCRTQRSRRPSHAARGPGRRLCARRSWSYWLIRALFTAGRGLRKKAHLRLEPYYGRGSGSAGWMIGIGCRLKASSPHCLTEHARAVGICTPGYHGVRQTGARAVAVALPSRRAADQMRGVKPTSTGRYVASASAATKRAGLSSSNCRHRGCSWRRRQTERGGWRLRERTCPQGSLVGHKLSYFMGTSNS